MAQQLDEAALAAPGGPDLPLAELAGPELLAPVKAKRFLIVRTLFSSRRSKMLFGLILLLILLAIVLPMLLPYGQNQQDLFIRLQGPSGKHILGTDYLGRDNFTLLFYGLRLSLLAGLISMSLAVAAGVPAGLIAGFVGGPINVAVSTVADVLLCIPPILFSLSVIAILGPSLVHAMIAIGVLVAPRFFRIARATTRTIAEQTFIEAARAVGCSTRRILGRHILTNSAAPLIVQFTFGFAYAIVVEAALSYLGLGTQPPNVSLGTMIANAFSNIASGAFSIWPPAVFIAIVVYIISSLGDSMQDALRTGGGAHE